MLLKGNHQETTKYTVCVWTTVSNQKYNYYTCAELFATLLSVVVAMMLDNPYNTWH